jgi:hypothetical protein
MKKTIICTVTALVFFAMSSCQKEALTETSESLIEKQLTAHTWQVEEVIATMNGQQFTVYTKGSPTNAEDYSRVRQRFLPAGLMHYTDTDGNAVTDGHWALRDNHTKLDMSDPAGGQVTGEEVTVNTTRLSYKFVDGADYFILKLIPE